MFIKTPFNYIGGKYRILPQIMPLFPKNINTMLDVFSGAFNVGINTKAKHTVCNDQLSPIIQLQRYLYTNPLNSTLDHIHSTIKRYELSKQDKNSFNKFREHYNNARHKHPLDLYILMCFSYNYQARWNNKHEYNSSHGTNRSSYNRNTEKKLITYIRTLQKMDIEFKNLDFMKLEYDKLTPEDFCYFDPPYILSTGNYNDGNRGYKNWTNKEEKQLYTLLQELTDHQIPYGLSNMIEHKGKTNHQLQRFIEKNKEHLKVQHITNSYTNSSYNLKKDNKPTKELYIWTTKTYS